MSDQPAADDADLVDVTGLTLDRIRRLCDPESGLDAEDLADRPVLRQALRRILDDAQRAEESFAGFNDSSTD